MELKFGCIVKRALSDGGGNLATVLGIEETGQIVCTTWSPFHPNKTSVHHDLVSHLEILGRPIRLADVLYAISIHDSEAMAEKAAGDLTFQSRNSWNLLKDDLSLQSPDTLEFLANLLK